MNVIAILNHMAHNKSVAVRRKNDTERQEGVNGQYAYSVSVEFWPILTKRGSGKNTYHYK